MAIIDNIKSSFNTDVKINTNIDNCNNNIRQRNIRNINVENFDVCDYCKVYPKRFEDVSSTINNTNINISNLNDKQNSLMVQLAYLNFNIEAVEKFIEKNGYITISQLKPFLLDSQSAYLGKLGKLVGIEMNGLQMIEELENNNLGGLKIVKILDDSSSGFDAIVLESSDGSRCFSFRGTDVSNPKDLLIDGAVDVEEYLTSDSDQITMANKLFNEYKNNNGKNYLFGHSLGGNIVYHVFKDNHQDIKKGMVINGLSLDENHSKILENVDVDGRLVSVIIEGDCVSKFKKPNLIEGVEYKIVKSNNNYGIFDVSFNHAIESATFDENGNFKISDRTLEQEMDDVNIFVKVADKIRDKIF